VKKMKRARSDKMILFLMNVPCLNYKNYNMF